MLFLLADWTVREVLKISAILLQYPTVECFFLNTFNGKTSTKLDFLCIVGFALKNL